MSTELKLEGVKELFKVANELNRMIDSGDEPGEGSPFHLKLKSALAKIESEMMGGIELKEPFYHIDGVPTPFDLDEDVAHVLIACDRALDFAINGPRVEVTRIVATEMMNRLMTEAVPHLKVLISSRIVPKIPFANLVNDDFCARNLDEAGTVRAPDVKLKASAIRLVDSADNLRDHTVIFPTPDAKIVIGELATMTIEMQQIMVLFGFTWDDVRLMARQLISNESPAND